MYVWARVGGEGRAPYRIQGQLITDSDIWHCLIGHLHMNLWRLGVQAGDVIMKRVNALRRHMTIGHMKHTLTLLTIPKRNIVCLHIIERERHHSLPQFYVPVNATIQLYRVILTFSCTQTLLKIIGRYWDGLDN